MNGSDGVIRISRKGLTKFAIGDENDPRKLPVFQVDVVQAFQQWSLIDESFRPEEEDANGRRRIPEQNMPQYHQAAVEFVLGLMTNSSKCEYKPNTITPAEAFDFIARLRECYDDVAVFFQPKSREERGLEKPSGEESETTSEEPTAMLFTTEAG